MPRFLIVVFCFVCYKVAAQGSLLPVTPVSPQKLNREEVTSSHQAFIESTIANRDKFSCVLNLLKNALAEELQNSYYLKEGEAQDNVSSINKMDEKHYLGNNENQLEKPITRDENEIDAVNEYQNEIAKKPSVFSDQNATEQKNIEMPNMIPIFRPRPRPKNDFNQDILVSSTPTRQIARSKSIAFVPEKIVQVMSPSLNPSESNQHAADVSLITRTNTRQLEKSRAVSFMPEKIIQTNMNPIPRQAMFNIPYQRAADVLDMNVMIPKESAYRNTNVSPIVDTAKPNSPNQMPASVNCVDGDDTVAMLFKPKHLSLQQVYGNLLKKTTMTVLVPYHMSKLGAK